ncbi:hypothetical protein GCM10025773_12450 [Microbacterium jejuense]
MAPPDIEVTVTRWYGPAMSEPIGELDPELVARALAKAKARGERLQDVLDRRMREYVEDETEASGE